MSSKYTKRRFPQLAAKDIVVLGEEGTGKTCFIDMFFWGAHFSTYDPTLEEQTKSFSVDGEPIGISMMDMNNTMVRSGNPDLSQEFLQPLFQNSGGFVLLFDVTSRASFDRITGDGYMRIFKNRRKTTEYGPSGIAAYPAGRQRFGCILVGNKADRESEREVRRELAQWWADSQNMKYFELDTYKQFPINEAVAELVRSTRRAQRYDEEDLDEEMESIEKEAAASVSPALKEKRTLSGSFQHALKKLSP